ncbi:unnamed protein product [Trichobilharzia regenti]|nr:unnamed protein product [Trichobilharzia regenti]
MTLVRDVTSLNSQTHQDTSVHSQLTIKPNITIISLYDDDNSQLKLYNFDNAYLKNFHSINSLNNELNTNRIIYFQTQRCINAGEEFLLRSQITDVRASSHELLPEYGELVSEISYRSSLLYHS